MISDLTTFRKLSNPGLAEIIENSTKIVIFVWHNPFLMHFIYLEDYKKHPDARINPTLLWEYDLADFDFQQMRNVVVQRVIERGWPNDWWALLNLYGEQGVKDAIKVIPYLNDKDMNFVSIAFDIPFSKMKCYEKKQSQPTHWNS